MSKSLKKFFFKEINKSPKKRPQWIRRFTRNHIHGCSPSCLPPIPQGKEPSNPLGKVHAITTANVPVDKTLHNKQTGEGGRANSDQAQGLSQNGSLFNCSIISTNINNSNKCRSIEPRRNSEQIQVS